MEKYSEEQVRNFFENVGGGDGNEGKIPGIISKLEAVANKWRQLQKIDPGKKFTAKRYLIEKEAKEVLGLVGEYGEFLRGDIDIMLHLPSLCTPNESFFMLPSGCIFMINSYGDLYIYLDLKEAYSPICQAIESGEEYYEMLDKECKELSG
ncbi:MAG: hypothetical protein AAB451_02920 [Patescibacteria group bacterium]